MPPGGRKKESKAQPRRLRTQRKDTMLNRTRLLVGALLALIAIGGGQPLAQGRALPGEPSCGEVITVDTTLAQDLIDCPGDGIVIGAANITLDLNRHTVDGDAAPGAAGPDIGVRNDGFDGVKVKGGTVREFDFGIRISDVSANSLLGLLSTLNGRAGMRAEGSEGGRLVANTSVANGTFGIILFGENHDNLVERNTAAGNGGGGIGDFVSDHDRIVHNVVTGNAEEGIAVGGSTDSLVEQNSVSDNFGGIAVFGSDQNTVTSNRVFRNRDSIIIDGDDNSVLANHVSDALGCDDGEGCGFGISVEGGADNLIADNTIIRTLHSGIRLDAYGAPVNGNVLRHNNIHAAGTDGIAINTDQVGPVVNTLLESNLATGAADDGIDIDSASTTVTRNAANHNGDLGIEAVAGVTDGGNNHASGNGNPAECVNITC
jgi:parallel beta-helix repeat protein